MNLLNFVLLRDNSPPQTIIFKKKIMKLTLLCITILICSGNSFAQLNKGNWLVGGMGNFTSTKNYITNPVFSTTANVIFLKISPNIGYFFIDKLSMGIKPGFTWNKTEVLPINGGGGWSNTKRFEIGPFVRYYFLNADNPYNILADLSYQFGTARNKPENGSINTFSISAGPVIYFNTSVGLEVLIGYYEKNEKFKNSVSYSSGQKGLQVGVGFQFHLEKQ